MSGRPTTPGVLGQNEPHRPSDASGLADCGHPIGDDFEWPGANGRTLCRPCFEAEADAEWWKAVEALDTLESIWEVTE